MARDPDNKTPADAGYESWVIAREYFDVLGQPHTLFVGGIKTLLQNESMPMNSLIRRSPLDMIFKTASIKSLLYFAAAALHPEDMPDPASLTGSAIINTFAPDELASVLAVAFLTSKLAKKIDPKVWELQLPEIQMQAEVGARIGATIPSIGIGCGMMCGAIRYMAMSLFSLNDSRGFRAFRRELNNNELLYDLKYEESKWGCNHLQIASLFLQQLGFGIHAANGFSSVQGDSAADSHKEAQRWKHGRMWIESLLQFEKAPDGLTKKNIYHPSDEALAKLQERIDAINLGGSTFGWTSKRREDLAEDLMSKMSIIERSSSPGDAAESSEMGEEISEMIES